MNPKPHLRIAIIIACALPLLNGCTSAPAKPESLTELPACGWLPNCVNTSTGSGMQAAAPLPATTAQWNSLKTWLADQPGWKIITADNNFVQLTFTTPTIGFVDDVQLLFVPEERVIQVRSSSRLGISDLGANAARVEALRAEVKKLAQ